MTITTPALRVAAGLALGVLAALAGCGSTDDAGTSTTATVTVTTAGSPDATPSYAGSSSAQSPPSPSTAPSTTPSRCTIEDLTVSLGPSEGAAGSTYLPVRLTNTSTASCRVQGFGGVSLVTSPRSEPVGAPADRTHRGEATAVVLRPGATAEATLQQTNADNYPTGTCQPSRTHGLRVYPPDETHSVYLRHAATACGRTAVHLLTLTPYRRAG